MTKTPLVSTSWLADHVDDPAVIILDATWFMPGDPREAAKVYATAHIPGAHFFSIDTISDHATDVPHMIAAPSDFAVAARRLGVNAASTVVVYDGEGLFSASRVWWNFRAMGHATTFVLDGGLPRWIAEGRSVETGWRDAIHGDFKSRPDPRLVRDMTQVRQALDAKSAQIVDARPAGRFTGAVPEPRADLRGGHMPGAVNLPYSLLVENGALLAPDAISAAFEAVGIDLAKPIVTTCGSGVTAGVLTLALAAIGRDDVAVYDGSWSEWGARTDTPVVVGP